MTRIIAGTAGGRRLRTPPGEGTRPTSDRVREALFSALQARGVLAGSRVLDLYAGSGALGLEALSRGAEAATFVESDRRVVSVIRANVTAMGWDGTARVVPGQVDGVLAGPPDAAYGLVLLDPPYAVAEDALAAVLARLADAWLADDAVVVVERASRSPEPSWPESLAAEAPRRYGDTTLWIACSRGGNTPGDSPG